MGIETKRQMALQCPLGDDVLLVRHLQGSERLSACFQYDLTLYSTDPKIKAEDLLGHHSSVRLRCGKQPERYFDGIVCEFGSTGQAGRYYTYRMVLRPWLWLLTRNRQCRVFQRETTVDIFHKVLEDYDDKELDTRLMYALQPREYCVQYRESDFSFISRMFEEEGIYYYFKHSKGSHKLVLSDSPVSHDPVPGYENFGFRRSDQDTVGPTVYSWRTNKRISAGNFEHTDYDFKKPTAKLVAHGSHPREHKNAKAEVFDFPGLYTDASVGDDRAKIRMEEIAAGYEVSEGATDAAGLFAGALFTLKDCPREEDNRQYLVTSASYDADSGGFESDKHARERFGMAISGIDNANAFRPPRYTPAPLIHGAQTATVVGADGTEIWTNEYCQVKVQFHWDRYGKKNEDSSCFVRVAQNWAGEKWGTQFIPRIGQEVVVIFLEGNPDRPLITGTVYNENNKPPYEPPGKQTQSGIKTHSTPKGSAEQYNELRFEDDKGHEEIHMQAQRDLTVLVKHDSAGNVGNDASLKVKKNVLVGVAEGDHDTTVSKGAMRAAVKNSLYGVKAKEIALAAEDSITLRVGDSSIKLDSGGVTLVVGSTCTVKLDPTTLLLMGSTVNINPPASAPIQPAQLPALLDKIKTPPGQDKGGGSP